MMLQMTGRHPSTASGVYHCGAVAAWLPGETHEVPQQEGERMMQDFPGLFQAPQDRMLRAPTTRPVVAAYPAGLRDLHWRQVTAAIRAGDRDDALGSIGAEDPRASVRRAAKTRIHKLSEG